MSKRNIFLITLFLALLVVAVYLAKPEWFRLKKETKLLFAGFEKGMIEEIRVRREKGDEYRLVKKEGKWVVASRADFAADEELVEKALTTVKEMEVREVVSLRPEKWADFGVDDKGVRVRLSRGDKGNQGDRGDGEWEFWVGRAGRDFNSTYVRKKGDDKVYLVEGSLGSVFGIREWRDLKIFGDVGDFESFRELKFKYSDRQLKVSKIGEKWMITEPVQMEAAKNRVEFVLDELERLRAVDATTSADLANFAEPEIELTVVYQGNKGDEGDKGDEGAGEESGELVLLIDGKDEKGQNRFAKLKEGKIIYLLSLADAGTFERTVEDFLNPEAR